MWTQSSGTTPLLSTDVPMEIIPDKYYEAFNKDGGTFDGGVLRFLHFGR